MVRENKLIVFGRGELEIEKRLTSTRDALRGPGVDLVHWTEFATETSLGELDRAFRGELPGTLTRAGRLGRVYTTTTPKGPMGGYWEELVRRFGSEAFTDVTDGELLSADGLSFYVHATSFENEFLTPEQRIQIEAEKTNGWLYEQERLAKFVIGDLGGEKAFARAWVEKCLVGSTPVRDGFRQIIFGVDIARFGEDETCYVGVDDSSGDVVRVEFHKGRSGADVVEDLKRLYGEFPGCQFFVDSTGHRGYIADFAPSWLPFTETHFARQKEKWVGGLRMLFQTRRSQLPVRWMRVSFGWCHRRVGGASDHHAGSFKSGVRGCFAFCRLVQGEETTDCFHLTPAGFALGVERSDILRGVVEDSAKEALCELHDLFADRRAGVAEMAIEGSALDGCDLPAKCCDELVLAGGGGPAQVVPGFLLHELFNMEDFSLAVCAVAVGNVLEVFERAERDTRQAAGGRFDVSRHGKINEEELLLRAAFHDAADAFRCQDIMGCSNGANGHISGGNGFLQVVHGDGLAAELTGQRACIGHRAIENADSADALLYEVPSSELCRLARADDEEFLSCKGTEPARGRPAGGGSNGYVPAADGSLGADAPAEGDGALKQRAKMLPHGTQGARGFGGLPHLAEYLGLAHNEAFHSGRDAEKVACCFPVKVYIRRFPDVRQPFRRLPGQHTEECFAHAVWVRGGKVELQPVAGGEDRGLPDSVGAGKGIEVVLHGATVRCYLLAEGHGGGPVAQAQADEPWRRGVHDGGQLRHSCAIPEADS